MKTNHQRNFVENNRDKEYNRFVYFIRKDDFTEKVFSVSCGCSCYAKGHREYLNAKRGAKKFVNSRSKLHERMKLDKIMTEL